ncbi:MAG: cbb3-type cytochrome c oxidase N-terminal domain-containing protein [Polyangiales bacterium]
MAEIKRTDAIAGDIIHEYDGIEEADNQLPRWWVAVFVGSVVFGGIYYFAYEKYHLLPSPTEELAKVMAEQAKHSGVYDDTMLLTAASDNAAVSAGRQAFNTNCVACHGPKGEGSIGPNLTDESWLHGGAPSQIYTTVRDGVPAKGMPTWGAVLGGGGVRDVTAYLLTVRNSHVAGKPPQGELYTGR